MLNTLVATLRLARLSQIHGAILDATCALHVMDYDANDLYDPRQALLDQIREVLAATGCARSDWAGMQVATVESLPPLS